MIETNGLIEELIDIEWEWMNHVRNADGRATCQEDPNTFRIMRRSQFLTWNSNMLTQYYVDLNQAKDCGINRISQKYAFMMESTHPEEYALIKDQLPLKTDETLALVEDIVSQQLRWQEEVELLYKDFHVQARPLYSSQDTSEDTSFETYLRGELKTYSTKLLYLYKDYIEECQSKDHNLSMENFRNILLAYREAKEERL